MIFRFGQERRNAFRSLFAVPVILVALCTFAGTAQAIPINGVDISGGLLATTSVDAMVGWTFRAEDDIDVSALGMWDYQEDGFSQGSIMIGLWTDTGTLLASTSVSGADSITDGFRYSSIATTSLTSGTDYVIAGLLIAPEFYLQNSTITNSAGVTWLDSVGEDTSTFSFPTGFSGFPGSFFGTNLQYNQSVDVPAPATLALFGMGLLGLGWSKRKKS